jgi:poly(A) polymerase
VYRRDFTVNALYLDLTSLELIDYTGGYQAIQKKEIAMIGDPNQRFLEDPVRMIRAVKFKAKLNFELTDEVSEAIQTHKSALKQVANARMFLELKKLLLEGYAERTWQQLKANHLLGSLLPVTATNLVDHPEWEKMILKTFSNSDLRVKQGKPLSPSFFLAVLLWGTYKKATQGMKNARDKQIIGLKIIANQSLVTSIPKRNQYDILEIMMNQALFNRKSSLKSVKKLLEKPKYRASFDLLLFRAESETVPKSLIEWWAKAEHASEEELDALIQPKGKK